MQQMAREGSGTAWLPDATPMYAIHAMKGPWTLVFHDNAFLQYLKESGDRGDDQFGSINWFMGMARSLNSQKSPSTVGSGATPE